jgi:putative heme-binding domain-containing protein
MIRMVPAAIVAAVIAVASGTATAQSGNPLEGDADAIRAGSTLYAIRCADCHSADARGTRGPDLTQIIADGASDSRLFGSIRNGVAESIMPPSFAPDDEIWAIVAYLRDLSIVPPYENLSGDPGNGREIFDSSCADCHSIGGHGGTLGPELSRIAQTRTRDSLIRSVRDPSDTVAPGFRAVTITTRDGEEVRGVAKSEDAFSIQILDENERLQGYIKADLESLVHEAESMMPRFGRMRLRQNELDDLIAYLATLRDDYTEGS